MMNKYIKKILILFLVVTSLASKDILIDTDHIYSNDLKNNISSFIKDKLSGLDFSKKNLGFVCSDLKQKYKIIKKVELDFINPACMKIKILGAVPSYFVNDKFVLANKKRLFEPGLFKDFDLKKLSAIKIGSCFIKEKLNKDVYCFVQNIPKKFFKKYDLNYVKNSKILLKPKDLNYFVLTDNNFIKSGKFDYLEKVLSLREVNKSVRRKELFDLRYDNCIVAKFVDADFWGREQWE